MVAQATLLLFGSFFVMLLAGVPISAGIGIASIFTALFSMDPAIFALTAAQRCLRRPARGSCCRRPCAEIPTLHRCAPWRVRCWASPWRARPLQPRHPEF